MEFLKFRMLREKIHAPVNNLNSLNIISQLIVHRPVVVQYVMPWSGRSQRFEKHYLKTSLLQQEKYFFIRLIAINIVIYVKMKILVIIQLFVSIFHK